MKRLQFRHHTDLFQNRSEALEFFKNITDSSHVASTLFGTSLYAEPMIAKYQDENGVTQVLVAIGVESGNTPYHIIDSALLAELIENNRKDILSEQARAIAAEASLSGSIETEIARAIAAEASLSGSIDTERLERIESDENLQQQISDNIASVIQVTENLGSNVREEYVLKNAKGEELGSHIKVYKDSALVGAEVNFKGATGVTINEDGKFVFSYDVDMDKEVEYLYLVYRNENGGLNLVALDFENFLMENEEGFGIKIIDHRITINIKSDEKYLKVTENGLQTNNIDEAINDAVKSASEEVNAKIDDEIQRSIAADTYISGVTADFSAATVHEFVLTNSAITMESERAIASELSLSASIETEITRAIEAENILSGAVDSERTERIAEEDKIKAEIKSNKINSKDLVVNKTDEGTTLTIQTDEVTITKTANAETIYDTNIAVLGTLLHVKKVEPLSTNIKSRYELQGADGKLIGDPIELAVESALIDVKQGKVGDSIDPETGNYVLEGDGDTTMNFVYRLENGTYELVQIVVSEYFTDSHFGKGLNNQDGVVSLVEGDGNEYLVIGEDTIAVIGVKADINSAITIAKLYADSLAINYDAAGSAANAEENAKLYADSLAINYDAAGSAGNAEEASRVYTDQRYNEATAHTETRISDVTNTVTELAGTVNTAINGFNETLTNSIQLVNDSLTTEITNREIADESLRTALKEESSKRVEIEETIKLDVKSVSDKVDLLIGEDSDKNIRTIANEEAAIEVAKIVADAPDSFNTLKEIADYIATDTTNAAQMVNDIESLKDANITIANDFNSLSGVVSDVVYGEGNDSINHRINDKFNTSLITAGLPATEVNIEEAQKHSLLREVSVNGEIKYYVSNSSDEIICKMPDGTTKSLTDYIKELNDKIFKLESFVNDLTNNFESKILDVLKTKIKGTPNEVAVNSDDSSILIGFDANAIFGEY